MKRTICLLFTAFLLLFGLTKSFGGTYYTVASGTWNSTVVWVGGQMPSMTGTDTIYIFHHLMYTSALNFPSATHIQIDTLGSLCGHERFILQTGAELDNYGELYGDSLFINGGLLHNYGYILLSNMALISNGGSFVNSGSMQIGGTFLCSEKTGVEELGNADHSLGFFPQPGRNGEEIHSNLKGLGGNCSVKIFSLTGEMVEETGINEEGGFYVNGITPGIYFVMIGENEETLGYGKLIITE